MLTPVSSAQQLPAITGTFPPKAVATPLNHTISGPSTSAPSHNINISTSVLSTLLLQTTANAFQEMFVATNTSTTSNVKQLWWSLSKQDQYVPWDSVPAPYVVSFIVNPCISCPYGFYHCQNVHKLRKLWDLEGLLLSALVLLIPISCYMLTLNKSPIVADSEW